MDTYRGTKRVFKIAKVDNLKNLSLWQKKELQFLAAHL